MKYVGVSDFQFTAHWFGVCGEILSGYSVSVLLKVELLAFALSTEIQGLHLYACFSLIDEMNCSCRINSAGIRSPTPILLRLHVLVMSFIGMFVFSFCTFFFCSSAVSLWLPNLEDDKEPSVLVDESIFGRSYS
jgi:hypothetical protein